MNTRVRKAFTLIELLVVVAIIAILAAIAVPNFLEAQTRSKVARAKADMRTIATAMETYCIDYHAYPPDWDSGVYAGPVQPPGEWMTYRTLSTPVAYLTAPPTDPFSKEPTRHDNFYGYWSLPTMLIALGPVDAGVHSWQTRGAKWMVYSNGPDLKDQGMPYNLDEAWKLCYDPSNGTTSAGDFGRNNVGPVPQN